MLSFIPLPILVYGAYMLGIAIAVVCVYVAYNVGFRDGSESSYNEGYACAYDEAYSDGWNEALYEQRCRRSPDDLATFERLAREMRDLDADA